MVIAGEASGDQYGGRLLRAMKARHPDLESFGIGGDAMRSEGMRLLAHINETSFMGWVEIARHYGFLRHLFRRCVDEFHAKKPRVVILIDYPGFNLRFAREAKKAGCRVVYYISPQVWAWGKDRAAKMKPLVDHIAVVFPFEEKIYRALDIPTTFVGHPLLEILPHIDRNEFLTRFGLPEGRILALLPGSRTQEIQRLLPVMLQAARAVTHSTGCIPVIGAARVPQNVYEPIMAGFSDFHLLYGATHHLMEHAHAAIVTSGTATVETAYYQTPMAIVYRTSFLNYQIGKRLIQVPHIGMANILADERIVPEFIQNEVTPSNLTNCVLPLFQNADFWKLTSEKLKIVRKQMGAPGASDRVADIVDAFLYD